MKKPICYCSYRYNSIMQHHIINLFSQTIKQQAFNVFLMSILSFSFPSVNTAATGKEAAGDVYKRQFLHVIQPKYALDGSQILGGEALLRWQRKGHGFTSPGEFIPLFERNGFIRKLDTYVFISVCQTIQKRLAQGKAVVPISVNVSRIHLYQEDFADSYIAIKNQYHIPDGIIELELTENILLKNTREIFTILEKLRSHGFCCSIDDFGSGYSSLNALKDLPVDVVKLDRVFFDQSSHVERNKTILKSMISMAKELDMKVVAEGIECTQQLDMLQDTGCDMVQGFIYAKPCSEEDFYHRVETE